MLIPGNFYTCEDSTPSHDRPPPAPFIHTTPARPSPNSFSCVKVALLTNQPTSQQGRFRTGIGSGRSHVSSLCLSVWACVSCCCHPLHTLNPAPPPLATPFLSLSLSRCAVWPCPCDISSAPRCPLCAVPVASTSLWLSCPYIPSVWGC